MGMSLALWTWKASSRVPSGPAYISTQALIRAAWARLPSSARSASRRCSRRSNANPTMKAPAVPSAENTSAAAPTPLSKVRTLRATEEAFDPHAHRPIHRKRQHIIRRDPTNLQRLVANRQPPADSAGGENDRELLTHLVVAGVNDHVPWIGVDAHKSGDLSLDARLFERLAYGGFWQRLAEVHGSTRNRPVAVIGASDHENVAIVIDDHNIRRGNETVRLRRVRVVEVVDAACHVPSFQRRRAVPYLLETLQIRRHHVATRHTPQMQHGCS